jgi:hypothetical protein
MINLKKIVFEGIDSKLKREVKKDISKFGLFVGDQNQEVKVTMPFDNELVILNCEYISQFEFPNGSENNKFENRGPKNRISTEVEFDFNYNNKLYKIFGII